MEPDATSASQWARLSSDVAEATLCRLPLRSLVRASAVCRHWRSLISDPFSTRARRTRFPWFFLVGQNNLLVKQNQGFGFDPESAEWIRLPNTPIHDHCFSGAGGLAFSGSTRFSYRPLLGGGAHIQTPPLSFPRLNHLIAVCPATNRIIVVAGARFVGGLVDIEDRLAVEIYDPATDSWALGPPLPAEFRTGNSSQWLCSALFLDRYFFVFGIFSNILSAFDLLHKSWSRVKTLRPPGVSFSFLIACRDRLVLAGLHNTNFVLWEVNHESLEYEKIGAMPKEMMAYLFDGEDDDARFASLKCVGLDGLVYVFNEDRHRGYPACVCEIGDDSVCDWRMVPPLPGPVNGFHKVIAFCSHVSLQPVLRGRQ